MNRTDVYAALCKLLEAANAADLAHVHKQLSRELQCLERLYPETIPEEIIRERFTRNAALARTVLGDAMRAVENAARALYVAQFGHAYGEPFAQWRADARA